MSDVKISEFVKSLAAAMNVTVEDGKVKVGNKNAYKEALPEALERHGAWTAFDKKAPQEGYFCRRENGRAESCTGRLFCRCS